MPRPMSPDEWRQSQGAANDLERLKQESEATERYHYDRQRSSEEKSQHSGVEPARDAEE